MPSTSEEDELTEAPILGPAPARAPVSEVTPPFVTNYSPSLHLHEAMNIPDAEAARRLQRLHPTFMQEVMDGRRSEQEHRHSMERIKLEMDHDLVRRRMELEHAAQIKENDNANGRFLFAILGMGLLAVGFGVMTVVTLVKGQYWPATGVGAALAGSMHQINILMKTAARERKG